MLTVSTIWTLCVLQFKCAIMGNQAWELVAKTPETILKKSLEKIEIGDVEEEESAENRFLYRFTLSILGSALIFIFELCLCAYLLVEDHSPLSFNLAFAILYKNLILFAIFATYNRKSKEPSLFETLNIIPKWAKTLDRVSSFLSAIALLTIAWYRIK
ncbi:MAG: hypothetical protein NE330_14320 [Lentisphaeraceae bacterium]|nr:hypothetical protein [Lentisphaeraceae bacterium]